MAKNMHSGVMRVKGLLEIASALYETQLPDLGRRLTLSLAGGTKGKGTERISFSTGSLRLLDQVARKKVEVGWINPTAGLAMAVRGKGPFKEPLPLKALAMFPSWDRLVFAVAKETRLTSFDEIREKRYPLRVSVSAARPRRDNTTMFAVVEVLRAYGLSLEQIQRWGGSIQKVRSPSHPDRAIGIQNGSINAVFDEGIKSWGKVALDAEMKFLPIDEHVLAHMEDLGFRRGVITKENFPAMIDDSVAVDFSGWPICCHTEMVEEVAYSLCEAIDLRRDMITVDKEGPLESSDLCSDTEAGPLYIPLHPGAQRYYREKGYLQ